MANSVYQKCTLLNVHMSHFLKVRSLRFDYIKYPPEWKSLRDIKRLLNFSLQLLSGMCFALEQY